MLNRDEVGGPNGEKPAMYQQKDVLNDDGYAENVREELILDRIGAQERLLKRVPNVKLYDRVSYTTMLPYKAVFCCCLLCPSLSSNYYSLYFSLSPTHPSLITAPGFTYLLFIYFPQ